ncbi:c-type cytochrome [Fulvivirga lutimaris]|uniref:c-type cytochrome n=1 Tax=Fulvivirga lutimaris TaxID=1819566 RepID=UPI0012BC5213|nr:c-type cytochrome [Fulvivirga lutimaris]MTI41328.1 c-type cytochrome [Fulvivirga lutimaris]
MKKVLKIAGAIVAVVIIIILIGVTIISVRGIPTYPVEQISFELKSTPESVERGRKLASVICANCHANQETGKLTGQQMMEAPPEFGTIYSANITQDKTYGIGDWTPSEIAYLLRTGIKRDGQYAPPYMAKLPKMADEDINAIISFLKSDDRMVVADPTPDKPVEPSFLTKLLCNIAFKPMPYPTATINMPDTSNTVELGKYLAINLECFSCHSADFKTNDFMDPEKSPGYFGGGNKPLNRAGQVMLTPNLTPDQETGIGLWTKEKFVKAVRSGIKEGESALAYPMMPYTMLTDAEAGAIYDYLQTIPPIKNKVERVVYD